LSVTRSRLPLEHAVFGFILEIANQHDLVPARRIGVDASTQQANASLRRLVRRDTGEDYQEMLRRLARASGIETPTTAELIRFDRARKNKTLSNADWQSETDPAARIAKMKDGSMARRGRWSGCPGEKRDLIVVGGHGRIPLAACCTDVPDGVGGDLFRCSGSCLHAA
jgi:hypothetical protein